MKTEFRSIPDSNLPPRLAGLDGRATDPLIPASDMPLGHEYIIEDVVSPRLVDEDGNPDRIGRMLTPEEMHKIKRRAGAYPDIKRAERVVRDLGVGANRKLTWDKNNDKS